MSNANLSLLLALPLAVSTLFMGPVPAALAGEPREAAPGAMHRNAEDHGADHGHAPAEGHDGQDEDAGHSGGEAHADHDGHDGHEAHGDPHQDEGVHLSPAQRRTLGIETRRLTPRALGETLAAPGEVRLNAYASAQVTPRIAAQVLARHARLGEAVSAGQALVTLSSVDMAQAQGELLVADREWQRVRRLGEKVVSERRFVAARVARQQARSKVIAYGMQPGQVDALLRAGAERADGSFQLLAPRAGTVIRDDFIQGERVEPGRILFALTDERLRWVEARMPPTDAARVSVGDGARVRFAAAWLEGRVTQIHHTLDPATRTQGVRIEVPDQAHRLHPGMFVDVAVQVEAGEPVLSVPEAAVLRSTDGDWQVFVADADEAGLYRPAEVRVVRSVAGRAQIGGLPAGTEVVTHGAFFLQSELAKGGFEVHSH